MTERLFAAECPDGCPPEDAVDANGSFYRLVQGNPPRDTDFKTYSETGMRPRDDQCLRCGLSVFGSAQAAVQLYRYMQRRHPGGTSLGSFVAHLKLKPAHGRIKQTGRPSHHHHTWWMYRDTDRVATFDRIVKDAQDALAN